MTEEVRVASNHLRSVLRTVSTYIFLLGRKKLQEQDIEGLTKRLAPTVDVREVQGKGRGVFAKAPSPNQLCNGVQVT